MKAPKVPRCYRKQSFAMRAICWIIIATILLFTVGPVIEKLGNDFVKSQEAYKASSTTNPGTK